MISQICSNYSIHTVRLWSGSCDSQFRSQYAFYMLSKFDAKINLQWNYFESFPIGLVKTESDFVVRSVETGSRR